MKAINATCFMLPVTNGNKTFCGIAELWDPSEKEYFIGAFVLLFFNMVAYLFIYFTLLAFVSFV